MNQNLNKEEVFRLLRAVSQRIYTLEDKGTAQQTVEQYKNLQDKLTRMYYSS